MLPTQLPWSNDATEESRSEETNRRPASVVARLPVSGAASLGSVRGRLPRPSRPTLDQLVGVTGLGWTTSLLAFLGSTLGYGTGIVTRLVASPHTLLYVGAAMFAATLGLDRLNRKLSEENE